jgi:hypothetical protein
MPPFVNNNLAILEGGNGSVEMCGGGERWGACSAQHDEKGGIIHTLSWRNYHYTLKYFFSGECKIALPVVYYRQVATCNRLSEKEV